MSFSKSASVFLIIVMLISSVYASNEKVSIEWILKPPTKVKVTDKFKIGWKLTGGNKVRHVNIHVCPFDKGFNCSLKDGRMDGVVLKGDSNREYFQHFKFSDFKQDIRVGDKFYAVGHTYLDSYNLLTDPIIITIVE